MRAADMEYALLGCPHLYLQGSIGGRDGDVKIDFAITSILTTNNAGTRLSPASRRFTDAERSHRRVPRHAASYYLLPAAFKHYRRETLRRALFARFIESAMLIIEAPLD